ncbi:MAG: hypothetical protein IJD60_03790 [Clostridia bacterium]|nr:hypothetical protein [Clostridia bacterium]
MRRIRRRLLAAAIVLLLMIPASSQDLRRVIRDAADRLAEQVFADETAGQMELTLPQREICALQLGVFDDGQRAQDEAERLQREGVRCIVWQKERMRIISGVALSKDALDFAAAHGHEAYVYRETMPSVTLRLTAAADALDQVRAVLTAPDSTLMLLLEEEALPLEEIVLRTRAMSQDAMDAHPENELFTSLARSLLSWCDLMDAMKSDNAQGLRGYAALTMSTVCRELRIALMA